MIIWFLITVFLLQDDAQMNWLWSTRCWKWIYMDGWILILKKQQKVECLCSFTVMFSFGSANLPYLLAHILINRIPDLYPSVPHGPIIKVVSFLSFYILQLNHDYYTKIHSENINFKYCFSSQSSGIIDLHSLVFPIFCIRFRTCVEALAARFLFEFWPLLPSLHPAWVGLPAGCQVGCLWPVMRIDIRFKNGSN